MAKPFIIRTDDDYAIPSKTRNYLARLQSSHLDHSSRQYYRKKVRKYFNGDRYIPKYHRDFTGYLYGPLSMAYRRLVSNRFPYNNVAMPSLSDMRLAIKGAKPILTPPRPPGYAKPIRTMQRFTSDITQVAPNKLYMKYNVPKGSETEFSSRYFDKLRAPVNLDNPIAQFNNYNTRFSQKEAEQVLMRYYKGDRSVSSRKLAASFNICRRDTETGIPVIFKHVLTDGANVIGKGQYGIDIAPRAVNQVGHLHDYLYTTMGKLDPLMNARDQKHPDYAFLTESTRKTHPLWGALAFIAMKAAYAVDSVTGTKIISGRNEELTKEQRDMSDVMRKLTLMNQNPSATNTALQNNSNADLDIMRDAILEVNDADSENMVANMLHPPAAAAGGFVVPHLILQPYATDFDAIRVIESKFEPVKTARYCQRVFKGDEDYVNSLIKQYPRLI